MLIFTYETEFMPEEFRVQLEKALEQQTGQSCLAILGCSGVYEGSLSREATGLADGYDTKKNDLIKAASEMTSVAISQIICHFQCEEVDCERRNAILPVSVI